MNMDKTKNEDDEATLNQDVNMKYSLQMILFILLAAQAGAVTAVDTSQWECKSCPTEEGVSGTVGVGLGAVSKDSFKFGEYTGLNDKGGFFIGDAAVRFRDKEANYWNIDASNLGLDSRALLAERGRQGKYKMYLEYDEIPHFLSDSAKTPFLGSGSGSLTLPGGWVAGASTAGMTALAASLQPVDLETKRKNLGVGVSLIPAPQWEYAVNVRHDTREGMKRIAGSFFFNAAQLVQPIDYVTDQLDASASYMGKKWQTKIAYYASTFKNDIPSLTWQNPYTAAGGETAGQLALPPENEFHQVLAMVGYQFNDKTRATADIAVGRMKQNEPFVPVTLNATLPGFPFIPPRSSLDGEVKTLNANFKVTSALSDLLRLNAVYSYNDHDNQTPQAIFNWVNTDTFVATPRTNLPYSFTQNKLKLSADYGRATKMRTSVGFDHEATERTYQQVDETTENTLWAKFITRALENTDLTLKVAHAKRDKSGDQTVPGLTPPDNPLMTKYNVADRERDSVGFRADIAASETVNVGLGFDYSQDDYSSSAIGLTKSEDFSIGGDISMVLTQQTSAHLFLNIEQIRSVQAGSQLFATPDWTGANKDTFHVLGIGVKHAMIKNKLDVGADYTVSNSVGKVSVTTGAPDPAFPDLESRLNSLKLYATYRLKDNMSLQGAYWFERYSTRNWMLENVAPGTIPNVLSLGEIPPSYRASVLSVSLRYNF